MKFTDHLSADRIGGLIWVTFGAAVVYGSWVMDRLDSLKIPPATVPGLVPGLLGLGLIVFGLILVLRRGDAMAAAASFTDPVPEPAEVTESHDDFAWRRLALSWLLCVSYGGLLLGHGVHYWILTCAFLVLHMLLLDESERVPAYPDTRRLIVVALLAPVIATVVTLLFQYVFLVRLP